MHPRPLGRFLRGGLPLASTALLLLAAAAPGHAAPAAAPASATSATAYTGACPAAGVVSQWYHSGHDGVDIANGRGTPIHAVGPGRVINSGPAQGYGQWIRIEHPDGTVSEYGHMYQRDVAVGDTVAAGQRIALMGSEGDSSGNHLHLRIRVGASTGVRGIDPVPYLRDRGVGLPCTPGGGGGGGSTVTAWADANVRRCASTTCEDISDVYAGQSYPANCWVKGQLVEAEGYRNDNWVQLRLNAGGVGYVSAIYLKGDDKGNVPNAC
ncbi:peptidoglycan DD-metalloendopeptidase family protein [Streptomyces sp. cmx-4-7]|uniref:peptidoglycan DD-metalloendopeptidase family protein n=1 Tax=Streptomyces sp. cmx-4-7 TaxID=2790939 RepID=UPI00397FD2BE